MQITNTEKGLLYTNALQDFFIKNKNILLIGIFVGIFVNAIDIFTFKFGIDAEIFSMYNSTEPYFDNQRFGSIILYYLFPFARFHILSQLTGIIALTLAGLLTISRHNIPNNAKLIFVLLFVTYPNFAFLQYFYFQSAYNLIGLLFSVIAYRLIENNKNIFRWVVATILLYIAVTSYQSNLAVFFTCMMINVFLDYTQDNNYKKVFTNIFKSILLAFICVVLYYITMKIFQMSFSGYHTNMIGYLNHDLWGSIKNLFIGIGRVLGSHSFQGNHTANLVITIILSLIIIYLIYKSFSSRKYLFYILLIFLWLGAIFSVNFAMGYILPIRSKLSIAYYPAFVILMLLIFSQYINKNKSYIYIYIGIYVLAISIMFFHTYNIAKQQTAYKLSYEQDVVVAENIMEKIYNKYPETYEGKYRNIVFYGRLPKYYHPLVRGKDTMNASFFLWDNGNPYRMLQFLQLLGFPLHMQVGNINKDIKNIIDKLPSYPSEDCVAVYNDTVIVKLK